MTWNAYLEREREGQDVEMTAPKRLVLQGDSDEEFAHERLDTRVNELVASQVSSGGVRVRVRVQTGGGTGYDFIRLSNVFSFVSVVACVCVCACAQANYSPL